MNVLVLNCGSSSIKFQLIATDLEAIERDADRELARGLVERIGSEAILTLRVQGKTPERLAMPLRDHRQALDHVLRWLVAPATAVLSSLTAQRRMYSTAARWSRSGAVVFTDGRSPARSVSTDSPPSRSITPRASFSSVFEFMRCASVRTIWNFSVDDPTLSTRTFMSPTARWGGATRA